MSESAEHLRSALAGSDLAEAADRLTWLCPGATALTVLGRSPAPDNWSHIRHDPAAVLLILRQPGNSLADRLDSKTLHRDILHFLATDAPPFVDWNVPALRPILQTGLACAALAESLSRKVAGVDPEAAWISGLLAPLGWYAACSMDATALANCLADAGLTADASAVQRRHWGIDGDTLARRVARRWDLPRWLSAIIGHLALPHETAVELGADGKLFLVTRLAVGLARDRGFDLGGPAGDHAADAAALGLLDEDVNRLELAVPSPPSDWTDPRKVPLLRDLLAVAAENRCLRDKALQRRIEAEADQLHAVLEGLADGAAERLRATKLAAMAEFAAGAGHEINNPLAVISGQAQYVLGHGAQWFTADAGEGPRKSLQAIINQTKRIHGLLRDLMQFARPMTPRPVTFDIAELLTEAATALRDLAEQRHVRLEVHRGPAKLYVHADRDQMKSALTNILRNGVEAAPAEGWARVLLSGPVHERVVVTVEDNGPGPDPSQREHLFDPFYSGRGAGRGRGLGLPTAWRLARLQGGDVRYDPTEPGAPTRFVLELPWTSAPEPLPVPAVSVPVYTETVGLNGTFRAGSVSDG